MLETLLAACTMDAAQRGDPQNTIIAWLFGADPRSPLRVIALSSGDGAASPQDYGIVLREVVAREAATLPEPPVAAVVLEPAIRSYRCLDAAMWNVPVAACTRYAPGAAGAEAAVQPIPAARSLAASVLEVARSARRAALN